MNLKAAFKEWACIVKALGSGEQVLIFRKGGVKDPSGKFQPEHRIFSLFPTFEHQEEVMLKPAGIQLLRQSRRKAALQDPSKIQIEFLAKVEKLWVIEEYAKLEKLEGFHLWSHQAVQKKFTWGKGEGLYVMMVRVFSLPKIIQIPNLPQYRGCKSWVELAQTISAVSMKPILTDFAFNVLSKQINEALGENTH